MKLLIRIILAAAILLSPSGAITAEELAVPAHHLTPVAFYQERWTGVAISQQKRVFVNFPRWDSSIRVSVATLAEDGTLLPFPNPEINLWDPATMKPMEHFVCVQSIYLDADNVLWILDSGNPNFTGVIPGGPKLLKVDPVNGTILDQIIFSQDVVEKDSYFNDVRIDTFLRYAYITDSGAGAILVVNLGTHKTRRVLAGHPSVRSDGSIVTIDGAAWARDGKNPEVHADGLALSPGGGFLYYHALTATGLYRIPTASLRDDSLTAEALGTHVELIASTGPADGLASGPQGEIFITALSQKAILRWREGTGVETLVQHPDLNWPDSMALAPDNVLYVTTTRIHEGKERKGPYGLYKIKLGPAGGEKAASAFT